MLLFQPLRPYAGLALLLDYGTLACILAPPRIVDEAWSTSQFNLEREYVGERNGRTIRLRLFRKGVFTLQQCFHCPPGVTGMTQMSTGGQWQIVGDRLVLQINDELALFETGFGYESEVLRQVSGFSGCEANSELSLSDVDLRIRPRRRRWQPSSRE